MEYIRKCNTFLYFNQKKNYKPRENTNQRFTLHGI